MFTTHAHAGIRIQEGRKKLWIKLHIFFFFFDEFVKIFIQRIHVDRKQN